MHSPSYGFFRISLNQSVFFKKNLSEEIPPYHHLHRYEFELPSNFCYFREDKRPLVTL